MTATLPAEPPRKTRSIEFATLLANYFDRGEAVYDFGCGDGYYLTEIRKRVLGQCIGIESRTEIAPKKFPWIIHPVDLSAPLSFGPPGNVLCSEIAEHTPRERLGGLLVNLTKHCKQKLVMVWANRTYTQPVLSPRNKAEVIQLLCPRNFIFQKERSDQWQKEIGNDLWYGQKLIYIFERPEA